MCIAIWLPKCLQWPFCPGVFIAVLAFVAAAVTFRKEPSTREKAIWIFVFLVLMCAEVWMMGKDRAEHDTQQAEASERETKSFEKIAGGINGAIQQSQQHFDATMDKMHGLLIAQSRTQQNTEPKAILKFQSLTPEAQPSNPFFDTYDHGWDVYSANIGTEDAINVRSGAKMFMGKPDDPESAERIMKEFDQYWNDKTARHYISKVQRVGTQEFFTFTGLVPNADEVQALKDRTQTVYTVIRFEYSDHSGRWSSDFCAAFQDVNNDLVVSHQCRTEVKDRHRVKQP